MWGGKITTFRKLAEEAADLLAGPLQAGNGAWTSGAPLPGGDLPRAAGADVVAQFEAFVQALAMRYSHIAPATRRRLARGYGSRVDAVLKGGLGAEVAPGLYECELYYLHANEWARNADDVLWRRTKLGLHYTADERAAVAAWCSAHWGECPAHAALT